MGVFIRRSGDRRGQWWTFGVVRSLRTEVNHEAIAQNRPFHGPTGRKSVLFKFRLLRYPRFHHETTLSSPTRRPRSRDRSFPCRHSAAAARAVRREDTKIPQVEYGREKGRTTPRRDFQKAPRVWLRRARAKSRRHPRWQDRRVDRSRAEGLRPARGTVGAGASNRFAAANLRSWSPGLGRPATVGRSVSPPES